MSPTAFLIVKAPILYGDQASAIKAPIYYMEIKLRLLTSDTVVLPRWEVGGTKAYSCASLGR